MAYALSGALGIDLDATSTTKIFKLGDIVTASDGAEYMYVRADAAITQYDFVKIDDDFECTPLTTAISGAEPTMVGCAQVAFADTEYGWVVISGAFTGLLAASCAADVKIGTTTTAGVLDDTYTDLVQGVKAKTTVGGAQAATACFATQRMVTNAQD